MLRMSQLPALLTVPEAAEALRVSEQTVRRWVRQGDLPAHRATGMKSRIRIHPDDLAALRRT